MTQVKDCCLCCHLHPIKKAMEDSLIKIQAVFADSTTGEVIAQSSFDSTIALLKHEDVTRYVDSFLRGIRQNKSVVLTLTLYRSKDVDVITEPSLFDDVH